MIYHIYIYKLNHGVIQETKIVYISGKYTQIFYQKKYTQIIFKSCREGNYLTGFNT